MVITDNGLDPTFLGVVHGVYGRDPDINGDDHLGADLEGVSGELEHSQSEQARHR